MFPQKSLMNLIERINIIDILVIWIITIKIIMTILIIRLPEKKKEGLILLKLKVQEILYLIKKQKIEL
jgi:hypothetical protein